MRGRDSAGPLQTRSGSVETLVQPSGDLKAACNPTVRHSDAVTVQPVRCCRSQSPSCRPVSSHIGKNVDVQSHVGLHPSGA